jgi:endoplasmic reticulum junction formation protein lunapark
MLGEDETAAKNRLALICSNCRLVNGQAPPGVRTIEEVGRWRCGSCGSWNGTDERRAAREMVETAHRDATGGGGGGSGADVAEENGWEKVARGPEPDGPSGVDLDGVEGSTAREARDGVDKGATKRVTRSMAVGEDES